MDIDNYMVHDIELYDQFEEEEQIIDFEDFKDYAFRKEELTDDIDSILCRFKEHYQNLLPLEDNYVVFIEWLGDLK